MTRSTESLLEQYIENIKGIYGDHLKRVILYGSYARGDYNEGSDIDIMILLDLPDLAIKDYGQELSYMTFDFNMDNDVDISPFAKNEEHFDLWSQNYPFYFAVKNEGIVLYDAA